MNFQLPGMFNYISEEEMTKMREVVPTYEEYQEMLRRDQQAWLDSAETEEDRANLQQLIDDVNNWK